MPEPFAVVVKEGNKNNIVIDEIKPAVAVVNIGTEGKKGEKGASGDLHLKFTQGSAAEVWEINHNLQKFPSVFVEDSANETVVGKVEYIDENNLKLIFSAAFSGIAYLN